MCRSSSATANSSASRAKALARSVILGFGESSVDEVLGVSELPRPDSSKIQIRSSAVRYGGQVATCMAACAAFGMPAAYLGPVGDDEHGQTLLALLDKAGVDVSRAIVRRAATRRAVILVEHTSGDRIVLWERDPALDVPTDQLRRELVEGAAIVHVDATDESAAMRLAALGREAGASVTCDLDRVTPRTWDFLGLVTHPIVAAGIPVALTGVTDVEGSLRAMRAWHPGVLCVTLGDRGSAALEGGRYVEAPAFRVRAVDTTGAGDVFRAGYIHGLVEGWATEEILRFANAAAAASCTRHGALTGVPPLEDVRALLHS